MINKKLGDIEEFKKANRFISTLDHKKIFFFEEDIKLHLSWCEKYNIVSSPENEIILSPYPLPDSSVTWFNAIKMCWMLKFPLFFDEGCDDLIFFSEETKNDYLSCFPTQQKCVVRNLPEDEVIQFDEILGKFVIKKIKQEILASTENKQKQNLGKIKKRVNVNKTILQEADEVQPNINKSETKEELVIEKTPMQEEDCLKKISIPDKTNFAI